MKKGKLTLGLVVSLASLGALAACNEVTYSDGVVLSYTDLQGNRLDFTAEELFGAYQTTSGQINTDFNTVEEVLIRKYYQSGGGKSQLAELEKKAALAVQSVKDEAESNATNNKTSYQEEFEKLLASNQVDSIDELYEAKLYEEEKSAFTSEYNSNTRIEGMRDGSYADGDKTVTTFPYSAEFGIGDDGYLKEQLPYHVSHILVKVSAASNEHTNGTITEAESRKISEVVKYIAGADVTAGTSGSRSTFGQIALQKSDDEGSAAKYGQLDVMDRNQADSFVNEFKFGIYAYESIYNQVNATANPYANAERAFPDGNAEHKYKLINRLKFQDSATYTDLNLAQTPAEISAGLPDGQHFLSNYFNADRAIGSIPYGAAVALGTDDVAKNPSLGYEVNGGSDIYYPRNVLFNKYFNNHWVAVITPDEIPFNEIADKKNVTKDEARTAVLGSAADNQFANEKFVSTVGKAEYKALPGFSVDTTSVLPGFPNNVLTNDKGQVILAVRAGASSYQGIHFMAIERSALSEFGTTVDATTKKIREVTAEEHTPTANVANLSEYYTIYTPESVNFPTYTSEGSTMAKTTYVNLLKQSKTDYTKTSDTLVGRIKTYNTVADTFRFQYLMEDGQIQFNESNPLVKTLKIDIQSWVNAKRSDTRMTSLENFDHAWATYAEYLSRADQARALKADGSQDLVSEVAAIGYWSNDAKNAQNDWAIGGACYGFAKK